MCKHVETCVRLVVFLQMASGRLAHSHYDDEADGGVAPGKKKRRALGVRVERPKGVAANFRPTDTSDIQEVFNI